MKLYYTVASQPEDVQSKPSLSLGGYKSSVPVSNSVIGNLFGDLSMYTIKNATANNYIGLILVNDGTVDLKNINIYFTYPINCASLFNIAAVNLAADSEGNLCMEHIPSYNSKPLYATFSGANGSANKVNIGDINAGDMVGIWIERVLDLATVEAEQNNIYRVDPNDPYHYLEVKLSQEDNIGVDISWD